MGRVYDLRFMDGLAMADSDPSQPPPPDAAQVPGSPDVPDGPVTPEQALLHEHMLIVALEAVARDLESTDD